MSRLLVAVCLLGIFIWESPNAQAEIGIHSSFSSKQICPCGPNWAGPLRLLIPQGAFGARFRTACVNHDNCYDTYGRRRADCDWRFRNDMFRACRSSRWPGGCRFVANFMYSSVRLLGRGGYHRGQAKGLRATCRAQPTTTGFQTTYRTTSVTSGRCRVSSGRCGCRCASKKRRR